MVVGVIPEDMTRAAKDKLRRDSKCYVRDDPYIWKYGIDQVIRRCVTKAKFEPILKFYFAEACRGHFGPKRAVNKILDCGLYWPSLFHDSYLFYKICPNC